MRGLDCVCTHIPYCTNILWNACGNPDLTTLIRCQITVLWFVILCSLVDRYLRNISEESPTSILRMKEVSIYHIKMEAAYCYDMLVSISQTTQCYIPEDCRLITTILIEF
jgi:hypothetical protein